MIASDLSPKESIASVSHNSDLVCDLESIVLLVKNNKSLLLSFWCDKSVHFSNLDAVQFLSCLLDRWLGSALVNNEDQSVEFLNGLDGTLRAEWVSDDGVLVPSGLLLNTVFKGNGFSFKRQSFWKFERDLCPDLALGRSMSTFLYSRCSCLCLSLHENKLE